ncbi:DUF3604 domain-containing protein, partial [bacterium]|nr:DUF3604 domain-containing protein [bacterium]
ISRKNVKFKIKVTHLGAGRWSGIELKLLNHSLKKGDKVQFVIGNCSFGSPGIKVPNCTAKRVYFKLVYGLKPQLDQILSPTNDFKDIMKWVVHPKTKGYTILDNVLEKPPYMNICGGYPHYIKLVAPFIIEAGGKITIKLAVLDRYQNLAGKSLSVSLKFKDDRGLINFRKVYKLRKKGNNSLTVNARASRQCGITKIRAISDCYETLSNPIKIVKGKPPYQVFWGDIHSQGALSDGLGYPDEYYTFARDVSMLDISAFTDHCDGLMFPYDEGSQIKMNKWHRVLNASKRYYQPGKFVTFPAFEWGYDENTRDHRNIYFFSEKDTTCFNWRDPKFHFQDQVFKEVKKHKVMVIPHCHVNGTNWDYHDPDLEHIVEIYSDKGYSEEAEARKPSIPQAGGVNKALMRGYRLGFVASSDYHWNVPGRNCKVEDSGYKAGYVAVEAPSLTRKAIWDALLKRQCYATTAVRILLDFSINGARMGEEINSSGSREITGSVYAEGEINKIENIKNGQVYFAKRVVGKADCHFKFTDTKAEKQCDYYYLKVTQKDGNNAWSSPIWVFKK